VAWYLLNNEEQSKCHFDSGGLASPPDSHYNSPIFPVGSSSNLQTGNLSPARCVNPRDLHNADDLFGVDLGPREEDNLPEQEVGGLGGARSHSIARSRKSSAPPSPQGSSEYECRDEQSIAVESEKPGFRLSEDEDDEVTTIVGSQSRESSSHPQQEDATMVGLESSERLSQEDDVAMADVESNEPSSQVDGATMSGIESSEPSSHPQEEGNEGNPMFGVESNDPLGQPLSESKGTSSDLSDSEEDGEGGGRTSGVDSSQSKQEEGDEESRPTTAVGASDSSSDDGKIASPIVGMEEANPKTGADDDQMSLDFATSLHLAAQFEPRRSSRNIPAKNKPNINYVDYVPFRKSSNRKKKPAFGMDEILLQASR